MMMILTFITVLCCTAARLHSIFHDLFTDRTNKVAGDYKLWKRVMRLLFLSVRGLHVSFTTKLKTLIEFEGIDAAK